ncbi:MAG TPA: hypothetical protein DCZ92_02400 [Elusimicrobia bacterium]|nr:MAG: hypothetical protein A2016_00360 [Elusimicrobia bacterium GWF2_62_30]HBA59675.1 hypothetical protein [Elusimicrobiota bacterium]
MCLKILVNSAGGGGAELQAALLAGVLQADFILLEDDGSPARAGTPAYTALAKKCPVLPGAAKTALLSFYAGRLAAAVKPGDTVLSFMQRSNFVNVLAARKSGHRAVICEVTQPSREYSGARGLLMKPLIRRLYPRAALVISNSKGNALDLEENFGFAPGKVQVIYNSCDTEAVRRLAAEPLEAGLAPVFKRPVIITSGRFTAAKGQWHLPGILAGVKTAVPDAALVLLGDGELREALLGSCAALGLKTWRAGRGAPTGREDVFFPGFVPNPYKYLARARVFAFPSLWEGLPNAVIEALACGLPVIASDCRSGPRELLAPATDFRGEAAAPEATGCGWLLPPFPVLPPGAPVETTAVQRMWTEKLAALLRSEADQKLFGNAARKRAEDFAPAVKAAEWRRTLGLTS